MVLHVRLLPGARVRHLRHDRSLVPPRSRAAAAQAVRARRLRGPADGQDDLAPAAPGARGAEHRSGRPGRAHPASRRARMVRRECEALPTRRAPSTVFVDEVQSVPAIFDVVQTLYDRDKTRWRFVLCGSSARKLRRTGANLLPGRCMLHRLLPLMLPERPPRPSKACASRPGSCRRAVR